MIDLKVTLVDGSYHEVDSSEMAFKIAGSMGLQAAARQAEPIILEPMMKVEVVTPDEFMGDVMGDLNARRGSIEGMEARNGTQVIQGDGAAGNDVRLRHRSALEDAGTGDLLDGVQSLRRGAQAGG